MRRLGLMPRARTVEVHDGGYKELKQKFRDATGLYRGGSRFLLFILAASVKLHGSSPWHLPENTLLFVANNMNLHGTRPWYLSHSYLFHSDS